MRRAIASGRARLLLASSASSRSSPSRARPRAALPGANGKIAFMSTQDGDYEVYTVDSTGGESRFS